MLSVNDQSMSALEYRIEIQPLPPSEGGGYFVTVPDLPGCMADGDTQAQALENILGAIEEWKARAKALGLHPSLPFGP